MFTQRNLLTLLLAPMFALSLHAQDAMPSPARASENRSTPVPNVIVSPLCEEDKVCRELTLENLLAVLEEYGVKHKDIVAAQAVLETGHFTSEVCHSCHNLFGLRHPGDGSYYTFDTWEESVKAYRDDVQYKYNGGDYYAFLSRIGYAEDRRYVSKVKRVQKEYLTQLMREADSVE